MKLICLFVLSAVGLSAANFSWVQTTSVVSNTVGVHQTAAFGASNTAGNIIVVWNFGCCASPPGPVTDLAGNTYTEVYFAGNLTSMWVALNVVAYAANKISSQNATSITAIEYHSASPSVFVCQGSGDTGTALTGGSFRSTTEALALIIQYNFGSGAGYATATLSTGTVRLGFSEPGSQGALAGDDDITGGVSSVYNNTSSVSGSPNVVIFLALDNSSTTFCFSAKTNSMRMIQ